MALGDVYSRPAFAPSQQLLQQQTQGAQSLPGMHAQGQQIAEQQAQADMLKRPVTPWQKAIMRLMAGEDPRMVAADTKRETGGEPQMNGGAPLGQEAIPPRPGPGVSGAAGMLGAAGTAQTGTQQFMGMPQSAFGGMAPQPQASPQMPPAGPGYGVQMPMTGQQDRDSFGAQMAGGQMPGDMTGMQRPTMGGALPAGPAPVRSMAGQPGAFPGQSQGMGGGLSDAMFSDMTGRDYNQFVNDMPKARAANAKQPRDYLGEIALKNAGGLERVKEGNKGKEAVAKLRLDSDRMKQDRSDVRAELDRRVKEKGLSEAARHNLIAEQIARDKLSEASSRFRIARTDNERLKAAQMMLQHSNALIGAKARILGSDTGIMAYENDDIAEMVGAWEEEAKQYKDAAMQFIEKEAGKIQQPTIIEGETSRKPTALREYKRKGTGAIIKATPSQFEDAIKRGVYKVEDFEP